MRTMTADTLDRLITSEHEHAVSMYLPAGPGTDFHQSPIRLKNRLAAAEAELGRSIDDPRRIAELLEPARRLLDDDGFWSDQHGGLAVLVSEEGMDTFRLPIPVEEVTVVNRRFYVKPLLDLIFRDGRFFLLAFSRNRVRLFEATRFTITEVESDRLPTSLEDELPYDVPEESIQQHTAVKGPGEHASNFHGQGRSKDDVQDRLRRFVQRLERAVREIIGGHNEPLVLAAVEEEIALYRSLNKYPHLLDGGITGNPDRTDARDLQERAWTLVEPDLTRVARAKAERFDELAAKGNASDELREVVDAAYFKRVDALFVAADENLWGAWDPNARAIEVHDEREPGDDDLLELAAVHTFRNGGQVFAVPATDVPGSGPAAALFRY